MKVLLKKNWFRAIILMLIAVVFLILAWALLRASDSRATVLFINDGDCPEVTLQLLPGGSAANSTTTTLKPGERKEIEVVPDAPYEYILVTESDPDENEGRCFESDSGALTVPRGSTFTFRVTSATTNLVFSVDENCPSVALELIPQRGSERITAELAPGEQEEISINPNIRYTYELTSIEEDPNGCLNQPTGTIQLASGDTGTLAVSPSAE